MSKRPKVKADELRLIAVKREHSRRGTLPSRATSRWLARAIAKSSRDGRCSGAWSEPSHQPIAGSGGGTLARSSRDEPGTMTSLGGDSVT